MNGSALQYSNCPHEYLRIKTKTNRDKSKTCLGGAILQLKLIVG